MTRRAAKLRKTTGDTRYKARAELERASLSVLIKNSLTRPLIFLVKEPIVTFFSLWIAFTWGSCTCSSARSGLSLLSTTLRLARPGWSFSPSPVQPFWSTHEPDPGISLSEECRHTRTGGAALPGVCRCHFLPDRLLHLRLDELPHTSIAGPIVGVIILMTSIYFLYLAVFNYLADAYLTYASSALAAQSFARNIFGFMFPLFVEPLYRNLGYQWASTLSALLGAVLGVVPFVLFFYGKQIRARSKISQALQRQFQEQEEKQGKS